MHAEAFRFIQTAVDWLGDTSSLRVVEFGAHNVNGSPRALFPASVVYIGVDPWPGSGVDVVCRAQEFKGTGFDVCITAEALEHDPDPAGHINAAWQALKQGGKLILTAASEPRKPHRCDGSEGDLAGEHYANVSREQLALWLSNWRGVTIQHDLLHGDIYAMAVKP